MIKKFIKCIYLLILLYLFYSTLVFFNPHKVVSREITKVKPPFPSNSFENIFWFVQISDIHISKFRDKKRGPDLRDFCLSTLDIIKPDLVLVTGDLTDAKVKNLHGSVQIESEWVLYNAILEQTNVTQKYTWIDVRGNHDAFDVRSHKHPENLYRKYSADKGRLSNSSWTLQKSFGNYTFIPVDATLIPGPKRPFNFMGHLSQERLDNLYAEGKNALDSNFTFWYGHYPSSLISHDSFLSLRKIIGLYGDVYLNGHFHDLKGIAPVLYGLHTEGFLELELKDWMSNRAFRILAVDHDMLSFTDVVHHDWPVILITNPKPATYMIPKHEPTSKIWNSTHVRFLIFSLNPVKHITASIDDSLLEKPQHVQGPLWVSRWNSVDYMKGTHDLLVSVEDEAGRKKSEHSHFSLDDQWQSEFSLIGLLLILTDLCFVVRSIFLVLVVLTLAVMLSVKSWGIAKTDSYIFKLDLLLCDNYTFITLTIFVINLLMGPLFVGELLTDKIGICFSFGLWVDGQFISECFIYVFCILTFLFSYIPVMIYLSHIADIRWTKQSTFWDSLTLSRRNGILNFIFLVHILYQCNNCKNLVLAYGWLSALCGPASSWWLLASLALTRQTWTRPVFTRQ